MGVGAAERPRRVRQTPVHGHGASPALLVLFAAARARFSAARRKCGGCAHRGFENAAPRLLLPARCCDDVPRGVVTRYGAIAKVQFGPFELRREYAR